MPIAFEKQLPATVADIEDLGEARNVFVRDIDGRRVRFVIPDDTEQPGWVVYDGEDRIGMVYVCQSDGQPVWRVQSTGESFRILDDAVRVLRRPSSWSKDRARAVQWAESILADHSLVVVSMETTYFVDAMTMHIAAVTASGAVLLDEDMRFTAGSLLPDILPRLSKVLQGNTLVSYDSGSGRQHLERELTRYFDSPDTAAHWLGQAWWEDAVQPYATWRGLWSHKHQAYRHVPSHDSDRAVAGCHSLLAKISEMTGHPSYGPSDQ